MSNDGLKTKAAKAAEFALEMKKENDSTMKDAPILREAQAPIENTSEAERKIKEMEKRITKMRNENQE